MKLPCKIVGLSLAFLCSSVAVAADKLSVVASFSVLGDITQELGGDKIALTTLVGANQDSHVYKPTPFDVQTLAKADVIVINGLSFEGWMSRLEESSGFKGLRVVASNGADIIELNEEQHVKKEHDEKGEHAKHEEEDGHEDHKEDDHQESADS